MLANRDTAAKYDKRVKKEKDKMLKVSIYLPEKVIAKAKALTEFESEQEALRHVLKTAIGRLEKVQSLKNKQVVLSVPGGDIEAVQSLCPDVPVGRAIGELIKTLVAQL